MWVVAAEDPTMTDVEVDDLERAVVDRLTQLIPDLVARIGVPEVVYFLMLSWTRGFSTQISPATESARTRLVGRRPYKPLDAYLLYSEAGINCDLDDWGRSSVLEGGERLELELLRRHEDSRRDAIRRTVARRLNDLDWTGRMKTSDDFIVCARARPGARKTRVAHLRANIDPDRFALLVARENLLAEQLAMQRAEERVIKRNEGLAALRQALNGPSVGAVGGVGVLPEPAAPTGYVAWGGRPLYRAT